MSSFFDDPSFQRQVILENYKMASNRGLVDNPEYLQVHMDSESCIDDVHIQILVTDGTITDVRFDGEACTISTAASSIMTKLIKGKSVSDALIICENYSNMIFEKPYDEDVLEEANVFQNIYKQPNRIKCAMLPFDGVVKLLKEW